MTKPIHVTSPLLPPLEEFFPYLEEIWKSKQLTNGGDFHQRFEHELADYLGVEHLCLFANGTLALLTALQALRITDEVITTPYSFVATSHSLLWNGLKPVFVDVDPITFNLDPKKIEAAITPATTAILPVHCYGTPCDVESIGSLADNYGLKVIYDAAHAFGVKDGGGSILRHGDLSVLSFHATKVFNTFEGGAIICPDAKTKKRIDFLKNFGIVDEMTVVASGINGKMSEINAAFGVVQLAHIDSALERRRAIYEAYCSALADVNGIRCIKRPSGFTPNNGYFPIVIEEGFSHTRDALYYLLREKNILVRRYFYPLISSFPMYRGLPSSDPKNLPVALSVAEKILCLPIHPNLTDDEQNYIVAIIKSAC